MSNKNENIVEKAVNLANKTNNVSKGLENTANAVKESANAVKGVSEHLEEQEDRYFEKRRSDAREYRRQVLDEIVNNDDISAEDKLKLIREYQNDDTDETVRLLEAYNEAEKAKGNKVLKIGGAIGGVLAGGGLLALGLNLLIGRNDKSA